MSVHETPSRAVAVSVLNELHLLDTGPPEDEYAGMHDEPPAYNTFEVAFEQWCQKDKARQAMMVLDQDPATAAAETKLKEAKQALKRMQAARSDIHPLKKCLTTSPSFIFTVQQRVV